MKLPVDFSQDDRIRAAFSYLTRIGAAPAFGFRPIGWYQIHQCKALDILQELVGGSGEVRTRRGVIEGRGDGWTGWRPLLSAQALYRRADNESRS